MQAAKRSTTVGRYVKKTAFKGGSSSLDKKRLGKARKTFVETKDFTTHTAQVDLGATGESKAKIIRYSQGVCVP